MIVGFADKGWEDYCYWQQKDKKILKRINLVINDIKRDPHSKDGIGKPEKLKENLSSYYSRRITAEHRLIYKVMDNIVIIAQCRFHY